MAIEITGVRPVHEGWSRFMIATVRLANGKLVEREVEDHGRAVGVLPYDAERGTALLVRQLRTPPLMAEGLSEMLEAIAGLQEAKDPATCARREAFEEVGLRLGALESVVTAWSMPGISTERISLFLAPYSPTDRVGEGGGLAEENESITIVEMSLTDLAVMADAGALTDLKTLLLVQTLRLRRPELFGA